MAPVLYSGSVPSNNYMVSRDPPKPTHGLEWYMCVQFQLVRYRDNQMNAAYKLHVDSQNGTSVGKWRWPPRVRRRKDESVK